MEKLINERKEITIETAPLFDIDVLVKYKVISSNQELINVGRLLFYDKEGLHWAIHNCPCSPNNVVVIDWTVIPNFKNKEV